MNGQIIVDNAIKYLGKPYVWGGESGAEGGYDCSGYVYNVLNDSGIKVGRTTAQGYYNKYKGNTSNKNVAGALLFFGKSTTSIKHVAIASGDGVHMYESIGSSKNTKTNKGKGVTYSYISRRKDLVAVCTPFKPSVAVPVIAKPTLKVGSKGTQVNYLQQNLNFLMNAKLETDGHFGQLTKKAVMEYQKKYNLVVDGIYGRNSYNKMRSILEG